MKYGAKVMYLYEEYRMKKTYNHKVAIRCRESDI